MTEIWLRRAYVKPGRSDGQRILVDRLWPRGVSKQTLQLDEWMKELAPSNDLRRWFDHDPDKWDEFKKRYIQELKTRPEVVAAMQKRLAAGRVTLVYAAKDEEHNNAVVLKTWFKEL